MGLHVPARNLLAPELFEPGKKPTGPVEIDWENPLAKNLVFFGVVTHKGLHDLVNDIFYPLPNATIDSAPFGELSASYTLSSDIILFRHVMPERDTTTTSFAGIFAQNMSAGAPRSQPIALIDPLGGARNDGVMGVFNSDDVRAYIGTGSGLNGTLQANPPNTRTIISVDVLMTRVPYVRDFNWWLNGDFIENVNDAPAYGEVTPPIKFGLGGNETYVTDDSVSMLCYWGHRRLTVGDHEEFQRDPWQIVKPKLGGL